jgi:hypothetical protein
LPACRSRTCWPKSEVSPQPESLPAVLVAVRDALNALYAFGGVYAKGVLGWSIIQIGVFGIVGAVTAMVASPGSAADRPGAWAEAGDRAVSIWC